MIYKIRKIQECDGSYHRDGWVRTGEIFELAELYFSNDINGAYLFVAEYNEELNSRKSKYLQFRSKRCICKAEVIEYGI